MKFPLHDYIKNLQDRGASAEFIDAVRSNAKPLIDRELPVILTLGQLAFITGTPYHVLLGIVRRQIDPYRVFPIKKRNGGKRHICIPEPVLQSVQRWIHEHILCSPVALKSISRHATAYTPRSSHIENARFHRGASWLLKLDISSFFESVSERQVYRVFRNLGYRALVAFCLARLCTRILPFSYDKRLKRGTKRWRPGELRKELNAPVVGHLPQGAPTSPMLANLVCRDLDKTLLMIALRENLTYTRYADDMVFSGDGLDRAKATSLIREISAVVGKHGFGINSQKTNIAKDGGRKIVTGISVEEYELRLPRDYKDKLRQELYFIEKYGLEEHCSKIGYDNHLSYLLRLAGRIRYAKRVEPQIGNIMAKTLERLFPHVTELEMTVFPEEVIKSIHKCKK